MLVDSSNSTAGSAVAGAIRQASQVTGASFDYLLATARVESGLNPQAGASTSSARGLFQFIEQTWLSTMKQFGPSLGYGSYAAAITKTANGHYQVSNPALRDEILKLRNDPTANAVMAGAFTRANGAVLSQQLGRAPSEGELYIAHFLGVGGAARLITLAANNPNAKAADFFPSAAQANPSIFYDRTTGAARGLGQVRDILTARYDVARLGDTRTAQVLRPPMPIPNISAASASPAPAAATASGAPAATAANSAAANTVGSTAAVPDTAGMTSALAAATPAPPAHDSQMFRGLFQDPESTAPAAAAVSALWGIPGGNGTAKQALGASLMLDLFKDSGEDS